MTEHEKWKEEMDDFIENRMATKKDFYRGGLICIVAMTLIFIGVKLFIG